MADEIELFMLEEKLKKKNDEKKDRLASLKVLVTEDDLINQKIIKNILEKNSWIVTALSNGREALRYLEEHRVDLILLDVYIPGASGFEVAKKIREMESGAREYTPIIALTAATMKEDREKCFEVGMDGYISKPVREEIVYETIVEVLKKKRKIADINLQQLLGMLGGDRVILKELIEEIISDEYEKNYIESIGRYIEKGNLKVLSKQIHKLKGSMSIFGADTITDILKKMKSSIENSDTFTLKILYKELKKEFSRIRDNLDEHMRTLL